MSIGEKIKNVRTAKMLTQKDLAGDAITRNMLSKIENGVAFLGVEIDGVWEYGYMDAKLFESSAAITVRNVLIVLAAIGCLCGSTTYFILRKKGKDY